MAGVMPAPPRFLIFLFLVALVLLVPPALGQDSSSRLEHFELFNDCQPMLIKVKVYTMTDEGKIYSEPDQATLSQGEAQPPIFSEKAFQEMAEKRLRAARLYREDISEDLRKVLTSIAPLAVDIIRVDEVTNISVRYSKEVTDAFGTLGRAVTWSDESTARSSDATFVLLSLSMTLDEFLAAYLRVNEAACEAK